MARESPPRRQLPHSFFAAFKEPAAATAARRIAAWAFEKRLVFQAGGGADVPSSYYIRVPDTAPPCYLLTLQPDTACLDVPFRRMLNGAFASREARLEFLTRMRRAFPDRPWDDRVVDNARYGVAPLEWTHVAGREECSRLIEVLDWALREVRRAAAA
jgi:hypothetical protein